MLYKIKHNDTNKIEEYIKLYSLFLREVYSNLMSKENITNLINFNSSKVISSEIKEKSYFYYLISYENKNIGIISLKENGNTANINQIYILKKYRKQGIAYSAIMELKNLDNAQYLKISIPENNKKLPKIIEKWGFEKSENSARYLGDNIYIYENAYLLRVHVK